MEKQLGKTTQLLTQVLKEAKAKKKVIFLSHTHKSEQLILNQFIQMAGEDFREIQSNVTFTFFNNLDAFVEENRDFEPYNTHIFMDEPFLSPYFMRYRDEFIKYCINNNIYFTAYGTDFRTMSFDSLVKS